MATTGFAVTYGVTFERRFFHQGIYYYPGVEYCFTVLSESDQPEDVLSDASTDYEHRFKHVNEEGCIVLSGASVPVIKGIREVTLPAAGESENENELCL
jgi:hypothetical protein